jgi:hypothetical protein
LALLLSVLSPLAANADEYKNHGDCVSSTEKGGEARSAAARSGCGKAGEVTPPPPGEVTPPPPGDTAPAITVMDMSIHRYNSIYHLQYGIGGSPHFDYVEDLDITKVTQTVDFGDGTAPQTAPYINGPITHTYLQDGRYTATVTLAYPPANITDSASATWDANADTPLERYVDGVFVGGWDLSHPEGIDGVAFVYN